MTTPHSELGPELRRLAQVILDGIDPAVRMAATMTAGNGPGTGKCQQLWCPVCALAALATGDQHPLLTVIADHSIALLEVIRAIVNDIDRSPPQPPAPPPGESPGPGSAADAAADTGVRSRYQPIPVTIEE
ncbi:hypothetical protein [Mycobacterium simiae]|uniref:Uncharacterized protein n=1 Tax=Mycobacterium simiae TaxID=1784 RepID=A0A1X0YH55_MYCSI|nr:hypothetical protein [Mycobacterium simiae]ORJ64465.1 hypothetical protein B5M45_01380 [Mycobacterium simiae]